ncbi:MAG: PAS domain S-box protein [Pseudomonadota bacterium]
MDAKTTGGFVVGVVSILAAAGISYSFTDQMRQDARMVARSEEVLEGIEELGASEKDLTLSLGRYLITHDESVVAERPRIKAAIQEASGKIRRLTAGNSRQQIRLDQVEQLTAQRVAMSDQIIVKARQQALSAGTSSTAPGGGSPLGKEYPKIGLEIDRLLKEMEAETNALLQQQRVLSDAISTKTFLLMPVGVFLSLTMLLLGLFFLDSGAAERKRMESERNETALRFRELAENIREVFWLTDPSKNEMLYVSPAYEGIWGRPAHALISSPHDWIEAIHLEDRDRVLEAARTKQTTGEYDEEFRIVRPDGGMRWIRDRAFPVRGEDQRVIRVAGVAEDITERKHAADEIQESARRFSNMLQNVELVAMMLDSNACITYCNDYLLWLTGWTREEVSGKSWFDLFLPPEGREEMKRVFSSLLADLPDVWHYENEILTRSRERRLIRWNNTVLRSPSGEAIGTASIGEDITERTEIDITRARLAAIVESSEDAIVGKDINGIVTDWNAGATKVFGYSADEMVGHPLLPLLPPDRLHEEDQILNRIRRGEIIEHLETVRRRKDGKQIDVSITVSPIRDAANKIIGASKIARDITERKDLEQQLRQSQKMEAVGQLTGGIAHDFNNLLGVVLGNLDLLERLVAGNEATLKRVQNAQKAAMRGADLTRRMLVFSSRQSLNPAPTSLDESIQNMIEMAARALGPEIKITTNLDQSVPPVLVDAAGLENVLLNLAVNARDAMPDGGSLKISTQLSDLEASYPPVQAEELKPGRYARITVSDTGQGMSREILEHVFEPFFTTKPRGKGTGLGLAMVYGFVKQSGGTVRIYSELGHGTTVSFYLPLAEGTLSPTTAAAASKPQATTGGTVLVVDDEVDLLEIAAAYLEEMGYRVFLAPDGARALEVLAREPGIELLVTDVIMPGGMNGVELARKVRQLKPGVKIVYSSGFPSDALAERSGTQVDGPLLYKPYQRNDFAAAIRRAMEGDNAALDGDHAAKT